MEQTLKQKTLNGLLWSSIERFSVQGVTFILGLIFARLLSPNDFGIIAMLAIFLAISNTFVDSGFSIALIRKTDRTEKDIATVFYFNIAIGIVAGLILFFTAPFIANFYNTPILSPITKVISFTLFLNSLCAVHETLLTAHIDFKSQAKIYLSTALISGAVSIIMAYCGYGVWALVMQIVIASFVRMVLLWVFSKWKPTASFSLKSFKELFPFGSKVLTSGLLDTTYNNIYSIVIGKIFNASSLGFYSYAQQFAQLPATNLTGILQRVSFPALSVIRKEEDRLITNYHKILRLSAYLIFPLMIGLAAVSDPLVRLLLTDKWSNSIPMLQIICFATMWQPILAINLNLLQLKGRSGLFLKVEVIKKIIGVIILCTTIPMGLIAMCWGQVLNSFICLIISTHYTGKLIHIGLFKQLQNLLPIFIQSLIMGIVVCFSTRLASSPIFQILIAVPIGIIFYFICSFATQSKELKEIKVFLVLAIVSIRKRKQK